MKNKIEISLLAIVSIIAILSSSLALYPTFAQPAMPLMPSLDPLTIPKYVNQLLIPPVYVPKNIYFGGKLIRQDYTVEMSEFYQQILPVGFPMTLVWGYGGNAKDPITGQALGFVRHSPAPSFEATRYIPTRVTWVNHLTRQFLPVDPTLHWANPNNMTMMDMDMNMTMNMTYPAFPPGFSEAQMPVPTAVHLHGGEVPSAFDGGPEQWWTANGLYGKDYRTIYPTSFDSARYQYPNDQMPTTLWYHDHALGITRINVMSGLAGFYFLRDKNSSSDYVEPLLPKGKYEIPIAIQDREFNADGSLWFPPEGVNPDVHPYWQPEFFGSVIMVNGRVWPNLNVDQGEYRFRILDGSNARFYNLTFIVQGTGQALPFTLIGTDGGYVKSAVNVTSILIAPGQRDDVLVSFKGLAAGTKIIMTNDANAPFPNGDPVDPDTNGQIMQFTLTANAGQTPAILPADLNPTLTAAYPTLLSPDLNRTLPFFEEMGANGPLGVFLNGQKWDGVLTEMPVVGSTEDWYLVNPTEDAHPIHTHLTQFQLVYRIPFNATSYEADWIALNGMPPLPLNQTPTTLSVDPYLTGPPEYPTSEEMTWRDTLISPPGYVTVIRIRFAPQDEPVTGPSAPVLGVNTFSFDPTLGPGYVWHCHIIDHEDNEMMRRYEVKPGPLPPTPKSSLSVQVYDMDLAGEFQVLVNGNLIFTNPANPAKNNIWTTLNFNITSYNISSSNLVILRNPTSAVCRIRNVKITFGPDIVVNDPTTTTLKLSEKQYPFKIIFTGVHATLSVQVYDMDLAGEFQVLVNGIQRYQNPTSSAANNVWKTLTFSLGSQVNIDGYNLVIFRNPTSAVCRIRNVNIIVGGILMVADTTTTTLQLSEKQYPFTV